MNQLQFRLKEGVQSVMIPFTVHDAERVNNSEKLGVGMEGVDCHPVAILQF